MINKMMSAEIIADVKNGLGEGIIWLSSANSIFWLDIYPEPTIYSMDISNQVVRSRKLDFPLFCLRKSSDGLILGLSKHGLVWLNPQSLMIEREKSILDVNTNYRFNDSNCDSAGRLWAGTMIDNFQRIDGVLQSLDNSGEVYRIGSGGSFDVVDGGYGCPNTCVWSPDEKIMYFADSISGWLYAYDFDIKRGEVKNRTNFFKRNDFGIPDGSAMDEQGCLWNARWDGSAVLRITPQGLVDRVVNLPVSRVTDCTFAGSDLSTLYITSSRFGLSDKELRKQPYAGGIFALDTSIFGIDKGTYLCC